MPGTTRSLPGRPSLRFLKIEAKRRLAAGEYGTLHDAQAAIAREHGLPNWAALKHLIGASAGMEGDALARLRWVLATFRDAGASEWSPPDDDELRRHVSEPTLATYPAGELVEMISKLAPLLSGDPVVLADYPLSAAVRLGSLRLDASVEAQPPHRLTELRAIPLPGRANDARAAQPPPTHTLGEVPAAAADTAGWALPEMGLAALAIAGGGEATTPWVHASGWADLDRGEPLDTLHRFPAPGLTALVTATAVLRLVASGRFALDTPANDHLSTVRLADETITVRELLSHTAGITDPKPAALYGTDVPDLTTVVGPIVACTGPRGVVRPSNGAYAVLGQLIADITAAPYAQAAAALVLDPLGMTASSFPASRSQVRPASVAGYDLSAEGTFTPVTDTICTLPAVGGLWATPRDLVRLGTGWPSLLPSTLAREALTPWSVPAPTGHRAGLGWLISPDGEIAAHGGAGGGATASLMLRLRDRQVLVTLTNRQVPLEAVHERLLLSWSRSRSRSGR